jgi:hypothetical protein
LSKCVFIVKNIRFLGHVVGRSRTRLDLEKVKIIMEFPIPRIVTNVQAFLGLISYYCNYIKEYVHIVVPLFELTKENVPFQ